MVDEQAVYAPALALEAHYTAFGFYIIGLMVLFYLACFSFLYWHARRMSSASANPLERFNALAGTIGDGEYARCLDASGIRELDDAAKVLAQLSHELRTPLNAVLGFAQLLDFSKRAIDSRFHTRIDHILAGGRHLESAVERSEIQHRSGSGRCASARSKPPFSRRRGLARGQTSA